MSDIRFETVGRAGLITLSRPKALNALSEPMVLEMSDALDEWADDDRIHRVAIRAEGKAFCAGGDVRDVHQRRAGALDFFAAEYQMNTRVKQFPKPYVALIDGICMGGGVGVSMHGTHRIASENIVFSMPEVGIGLFPDVGASHLLSALAGEAGMYLALAGARLGRDDAAALGLVTHPTLSDRLDDALDRTAHARDLDRALDELPERTAPRDPQQAAVIERCFSGTGVGAILDALDDVATGKAATENAFSEAERDFAKSVAATIRTKSPTSLCVTFEEIRRARGLPFEDAIRTEFRIVSQIIDGHDLYEGIRAVLIDKDHAPRWSPATLDGVDPEFVEAHFAEPGHGDLHLPSGQSQPASPTVPAR
ncbi:enoyl-CoA hydratase/isomerase family protein [Acuticoccus sp. MNP-M23]|uniref:enoyl-CoA hydratase/isomerase family protein n=1 Tax=Acuticoccus sp. MNP-M23 TaxID=3072793 RepID=UPI0028150032|nr:enoyl-CoA hydratase/isomerase family protein [Acuticoccus sp. MNP-M23]WMS42469.1 enoyl-CoA hydratase/isomerase family protein [Acuticoccus sp. MNP-M23]